MTSWSRGALTKPQRIAIVDEAPQEQFLFPEMQAFAALFLDWGVPAAIVAPQELAASATGVFLAGERIWTQLLFPLDRAAAKGIGMPARA